MDETSTLRQQWFHRRVWLLAGLIAISGVIGAIWLRAVRRPRNLVIICIDTLRYDAFVRPERAGVTDPLTPWLGSAVSFSNAQTSAPWTVPAVASLFTGLYPVEHGAGRFSRDVANLDNDPPSVMSPTVPTLVEELADSGFDTAAFHNNAIIDPAQGVLRGFRHVRRISRGSITDAALEWLTSREDKSPFLLYVHLMEVHERHMGHLSTISAAAGGLDPRLRERVIAEAPGGTCSDPSTPRCGRFQAYATAVRDERAAVAKILETLQRRQVLGRTVVVLYSDHGEEFLDHLGAEAAAGGDPRGFYGDGHGHSLYQELLHVPLIVWHPRIGGKIVSEPAVLVDVAPTVREWFGLKQRNSAGVSLARAARRGADSTLTNRLRYATGIAYGPQQFSARRRAVKVVERADSGGRYFFDLARDPGEGDPRTDGDRAVLTALRHFRSVEQPPLESPGMDRERLEALRSIGYMGGQRKKGDSPETARLWSVPESPMDCDEYQMRSIEVHWSAPAVQRVELRWKKPDGTLWTNATPTGNMKTGYWPFRGDTVYLLDASKSISDPKRVLAELTPRCK